MQCRTQDQRFNCMLIDFRDRLYWKYESEWYIQSIQDTTNRLKLLYDGYSQDNQLLKKNIQLLKKYTNKLFKIETQLLTLIGRLEAGDI